MSVEWGDDRAYKIGGIDLYTEYRTQLEFFTSFDVADTEADAVFQRVLATVPELQLQDGNSHAAANVQGHSVRLSKGSETISLLITPDAGIVEKARDDFKREGHAPGYKERVATTLNSVVELTQIISGIMAAIGNATPAVGVY